MNPFLVILSLVCKRWRISSVIFVALTFASQSAIANSTCLLTAGITSLTQLTPKLVNNAPPLPACTVPQGNITFSQSTVNFPTIAVGAASPTPIIITVTNNGIRPVSNLYFYTESDDDGYYDSIFPVSKATASPCPYSIAAGASCTIQLGFASGAYPGNFTGVLYADYQTGGSYKTTSAMLTGMRTGALIEVSTEVEPPPPPEEPGILKARKKITALNKGASAPSISVTIPVTYQGRTSAPKFIVLKNVGNTTFNASGWSFDGDMVFSIPMGVAGGTCVFPIVLNPGAQCTVGIVFNAPMMPLSHYDNKNGTLKIVNGATILAQASIDTAVAKSPLVPTEAPYYNFGNVETGQIANKAVLFTNQSQTETLTLGTSTTNSSIITVNVGPAVNCASGVVLTPGQSCYLGLRFTAPNSGSAIEDEVFASIPFTGSVNAMVTSFGVQGYYFQPAPNITISPSSFDFGAVPFMGQATKTFTVSNNSAKPVTITEPSLFYGSGYTIESMGSTCSAGSLAANATCAIVVVFTPPDPSYGQINGSVGIEADGVTFSSSINAKVVPADATIDVPYPPYVNAPVGIPQTDTFYVYNKGAAALNITSVTLDAGPAEISIAPGGDGCTGQSLSFAAQEFCSITVQFLPTAMTPSSLTRVLSIASNDVTTPTLNVTVSAYVSTPETVADYAPNTLTFGSQATGTTSAAQYFSFANVSEQNESEPAQFKRRAVSKVKRKSGVQQKDFSQEYAIAVSSIVSSSTDFPNAEITHNCPTDIQQGLQPGSCCTVAVKFAPTALTPSPNKSGTITVNSSAVSIFGTLPPQNLITEHVSGNKRIQSKLAAVASVAVSGVAVAGATAPVITSNAPTNGTAGAAYSHTFVATGTGMITWALVPMMGTLPPGLTLTAAGLLSGTPSMSGMYMFAVMASNGTMPDATQNVTLTILPSLGNLPTITGNPPAGGLLGVPYAHSFAATGTAPITWSIIGGALPPGLVFSSTGAITGTPTAAGSFTFTVRASNSAGQVSQATAIGITIPIIPVISINPDTLNFGSQNVGTVSNTQPVTVSNSGNGAFDIRSLTSVGDFTYAANCPPTLQPGASCRIDVAFAPLTAGPLSGLISVNSSAQRGGTSISMTGTGVSVPRANFVVNPGSVAFGDQAVGSRSLPQPIFISNTGLATLELRGIELTGADFIRTDPQPEDNPRMHPNCGGTVAPGASCVIGMLYTPLATGLSSGRLVISHNGTVTGAFVQTTVGLTGNGTPRREALIRVAGTVAFGDQILGTTSDPQSVVVTNTGTINLNVGEVPLSSTNTNTNGSDFSVASNCTTLTPNSSCSLTVRFSPNGNIGAKAATINIASNATNAAAGVVSLSGNALPIPQPIARFSSTSLGFGNVIIGGAAASQRLSISNVGVLPLNISGIAATGEFRATHNCTTPLTTNQSCNVDITFAPLGIGERGGSLNLNTNTTPAATSIRLSGTGCRYLSPAAQRIFVSSCG